MDHLKLLVEDGIDIPTKTIYLMDEINKPALHQVMTGLALFANLQGGPEHTTIVINTEGGDPHVGFGIYDSLRLFSDGDVKVVVVGECCSAGMIILMAGDERIITENSTLLIHYGMSTTFDGETKRHHEKLDARTAQIIHKTINGKASLRTVKRWLDKETYFDSNKALEKGLVTRVLKHE